MPIEEVEWGHYFSCMRAFFSWYQKSRQVHVDYCLLGLFERVRGCFERLSGGRQEFLEIQVAVVARPLLIALPLSSSAYAGVLYFERNRRRGALDYPLLEKNE